MNIYPILACGPSAGFIYAALGILGSGVLFFVSGIFCLSTGNKGLGALLIGTPVSLFGLVYLWASLH
jgi:hypothetical protein